MEGMKLVSDVYTKLYDSYFKVKVEKTGVTEEVANLKVIKNCKLSFLFIYVKYV